VSERAEFGGGDSRPQPPADETVIRYEEEATAEKTPAGFSSVRVRREVESGAVQADYPRERDELALERVPADDDDSGEIKTLPDGSISIPLFEEELVVTKRSVLRERVIIRKDTVTEWETVEANLRREHISVQTDAPQD
jgi:uncharacterized protein (TIGR02271 family)